MPATSRGRRLCAVALLAAVAAPALGGAAPLTIAQGDTPYVATRLVARWRALMNTTLEESRAFASEPVTELMEVFVSPGAVRLVQDKASDEQIQRIDAVVQRFALAVVSRGEKQPDGSVIVEESDVDEAGKGICPVYPFCAQ